MNQEYLENLEQQLMRLMERIIEIEERQNKINQVFIDTNTRQSKLNSTLIDFMKALAGHFRIQLEDIHDGLITPNVN